MIRSDPDLSAVTDRVTTVMPDGWTRYQRRRAGQQTVRHYPDFGALLREVFRAPCMLTYPSG